MDRSMRSSGHPLSHLRLTLEYASCEQQRATCQGAMARRLRRRETKLTSFLWKAAASSEAGKVAFSFGAIA